MITTIDAAGRVVIPRAMRQASGFAVGEVRLEADGTGVRIEPVATADLVERDGHLVLPDSLPPLADAKLRELRLAAQR
jgi:bifunctional DNA-binding transcriptional regulator/antitoxin component of YhaV-PrlF toxin-antitoxin module